MKRRIEIVLEIDDNRSKMSITQNGNEIPCLYGYNLDIDSRANTMKFLGRRLATDQYGQFFVNDKGETATEEIDFMRYLSDEGYIAEKIVNTKKMTEYALKNLRDTTLFNARKMIQTRLGVTV